MNTSMYGLYVGVDYTYIDVNTLAQCIKYFLASQVWFQSVAVAPIRAQLLVSHANHSSTETSLKRMFSKPIICVVTRNHAVHL